MSGALWWNGSQLGMAGSAGGWTDSGTDIYTTTSTDKVGIGTSSPGATLSLQNSASGDWNHMLTMLAPSANNDIHTAGVLFGRAATTNESAVMHFVPSATSQKGRISFGIYAYNDLLNIEGTGNVGIGTTSPNSKLDVNGTAEMTGFKLTTSPTNGYVLTSDASGTGTWQAATGGGWTDDGTVVRLTTITDKVGIGDSSPTHTLDVAGKVGINDTQVLYLPDQTNFTGTLYLGTGGGSLSHTSTNDGRYNTAVGIDALNANTTGYWNMASGYRAFYSNTTGDYNTALGWDADVASGNLENATVIGAGAEVDASNKVRIGNGGVEVIEGQVAFTASSDSTKKENFLRTDGEEVLEEISHFRLGSWNFKGHDAARFRHYGPMAQDFFSAFGYDGIGTAGTDTTICASDIDGINMIAIQALEKRTTELREKVIALGKENKMLRELAAQSETMKAEIAQLKNISEKFRVVFGKD